MKKIVLQMLLRAAQTAIITLIVALFLNWCLTVQRTPNFSFDWQWILKAVMISVCVFVLSLYVKKVSWKGKKFYHGEGFFEGFCGGVMGILVTVTEGIQGLHQYDVSAWLQLATVVIVVIVSFFWKESSRSILFAISFTGVYGIFFNVFYADSNDWLFSVYVLSIIIVASRIIRFIIILLFFTDHSFLKEESESNGMKVIR